MSTILDGKVYFSPAEVAEHASDKTAPLLAEIERLKEQVAALSRMYDGMQRERDDLRAQLEALVMAVASKYPGESRYETALRYIKRAEELGGAQYPEQELRSGQPDSADSSRAFCGAPQEIRHESQPIDAARAENP